MPYIRNIANITFKQFTKWCFTLWFYNIIKKWEKKKRVILFWGKKAEEKKQCYHNDICTWKGTVFPVKLKLQEYIVLFKILKREF